jgi:hypothetical protein
MDNHTDETVPANWKSSVFGKAMNAACAVVAMALLGGCAAGSLGKEPKDIVAERAQQRWDLLVKNDFAAAYGYISPAGREVVKQDAYVGSLKRGFWNGAKVDAVKCETADACEVDVWIEYTHLGIKMRTPVHEKWVRQGSNWWFVY